MRLLFSQMYAAEVKFILYCAGYGQSSPTIVSRHYKMEHLRTQALYILYGDVLATCTSNTRVQLQGNAHCLSDCHVTQSTILSQHSTQRWTSLN